MPVEHYHEQHSITHFAGAVKLEKNNDFEGAERWAAGACTVQNGILA
jgi:hypothetical protein